MDEDGRALTLRGGVVIVTAEGYRIETPEVTAAMDRTRLESAGAVTAEGPVGRIEAGGMLVTADAGKPGSHVLVFDKGVRLRYDPAP